MSATGAISNNLKPGKKSKESKSQRRQRLIRESINSALWRLANMPGCIEYIKGTSSHDPIEALEAMKKNGKVIYDSNLGLSEGDPIAQVHGKDVGTGKKSTIRLGDKWFDDSTVGKWKGTMNTIRTRTNILLHELKHAVDKGHAPNEAANEYYKNITEKCFGVKVP